MFPVNSTSLVGTAPASCVKKFLVLLIFLLGFHAPDAWAQFDRPGDTMPELPEFLPPDQEKILPDAPIRKGKGAKGWSGGMGIFIKRYKFSGNTVFSDQELEKIAVPYANWNVSLADLEKLRGEINSAYIKRGYINSDVIVLDHDVKDGVIPIQINEGSWLISTSKPTCCSGQIILSTDWKEIPKFPEHFQA